VSVGGQPALNVVILDASHASATLPVLTAGTLNDLSVTNPGAATNRLINGWFANFSDVSGSDPFHDAVEKVVRNHVSAGYGNGFFGRDEPVTRAQMAAFVLKGGIGPAFEAAPCSFGSEIFDDVSCASAFAPWIEELYRQRITGGCGENPLVYCPDAHITRAQTAVFLLKARHGAGYEPPACAGVFDDVPCPDGFAADWIEELYRSGVSAGCSSVPLLFCPDSPVSRGQMAVLIVRIFGLP